MVQRGGKVKYHAPGQLVGYLLFDLSRHAQDIAWSSSEPHTLNPEPLTLEPEI